MIDYYHLLVLHVTPEKSPRQTYESIFNRQISQFGYTIEIDNEKFDHNFVYDFELDYGLTLPYYTFYVFKVLPKSIEWSELNYLKNVLEQWIIDICKDYECQYEIKVCSTIC